MGSPNPLLESSWRALGGVLEVSWKLFEGAWRHLEVLWRRLGGLLETFEGFFGAPESILEASGGYLRECLKNIEFLMCFIGF